MDFPEPLNPYSPPTAPNRPDRAKLKHGESRFGRGQQRAGTLICLFAFAAVMVYMGFDGYEVNLLPVEYFGYLLAACGTRGVLGINIWRGGPFDPRRDSKPEGDEAPIA